MHSVAGDAYEAVSAIKTIKRYIDTLMKARDPPDSQVRASQRANNLSPLTL